MSTLFLVRGLPGSGKNTLIERLIGQHVIVTADTYFTTGGEYKFDPVKLPEAHEWCQNRAKELLRKQGSVAVCNTFSCRWEMQPYFTLDKGFKREGDMQIHVLDLYDGGLTDEELAIRGKHGVPVERIKAMRERWEHNWREGNPLSPWER